MSDLLSHLEALSNKGAAISLEDIEQLMKKMKEDISMTELHQFINFISEQVGILEAEWAFSPVNAPNTDAKAKADLWDKLWKTCSNMLLAQVPDIKDQIEQKHNLIVAQHALRKSLTFNSDKPVRKTVSAGLSKIAIGLGSMGLSGIANHLYRIALYPSGTVGRSGK